MKLFMSAFSIAPLAAVAGLAFSIVQPAIAEEANCACRVPAAQAGVQIGELSAVEGKVAMSGVSGYVAATAGAGIYPGTSVLVGPASSASLRFGSGCALAAPANATVEIAQASGQAPICVAMTGGVPTEFSSSSENGFPFFGAGAAGTGGIGGVLFANAPFALFAGAALSSVALSTTAEYLEDDDPPPASR